jgi:hypothetical protein
VVAQEVKALAAQTAKATDEIGAQISGMQSATHQSVAAIKEIGSTIGRISEIAANISAAVEEQGASTREISRNVQEAAKGTAQVATNIVDVNRGAGETGSASAQVLSSARSLSRERCGRAGVCIIERRAAIGPLPERGANLGARRAHVGRHRLDVGDVSLEAVDLLRRCGGLGHWGTRPRGPAVADGGSKDDTETVRAFFQDMRGRVTLARPLAIGSRADVSRKIFTGSEVRWSTRTGR